MSKWKTHDRSHILLRIIKKKEIFLIFFSSRLSIIINLLNLILLIELNKLLPSNPLTNKRKMFHFNQDSLEEKEKSWAVSKLEEVEHNPLSLH